ncbi:uncharacterized protein LOC143460930 [Clavelina lepadiformis]|uniref:uncharacterized protein LOC143460930 n=1 Tax=Clavelina lepadiformis TaxID=159417 RepID=UPI0040425A37
MPGKILLYTLVVFAFCSFVLSVVFSYLNTDASRGDEPNPVISTLYKNSTTAIDKKYPQEITPIGTVFGIVWPVIYLWNAVGIVYILISLFLPQHKSPVKIEPTLTPYHFLVSYIFLFLIPIAWLFSFDNEILELSLAFLILAAVVAYITIGISCKRTHDSEKILKKSKSKAMLWLMRILVQNGLCVLATWLTIAMLINVVNVIIYYNSPGLDVALRRDTLNQEDASTVGLSLLMFFIISWFIIENVIWEKYCRYNFTIYPVVILGSGGLVARLRVEGGTRNLILASVVLGISSLAFIVRIILSVYRSRSRNRGTSGSGHTLGDSSL